jgi:hypothetical protein
LRPVGAATSTLPVATLISAARADTVTVYCVPVPTAARNGVSTRKEARNARCTSTSMRPAFWMMVVPQRAESRGDRVVFGLTRIRPASL